MTQTSGSGNKMIAGKKSMDLGAARPGRVALRTALLMALWVLVCAGPGAAVDAPPSSGSNTSADTWYATSFVSASNLGIRVIHYWSKGPWMRAQTVVQGHPVVTIVRGSEYIAYDVATGQGARIRRAPAAVSADGQQLRPFANDLPELIAQGAEKVEDTRVGGQRGETWRVTDSAGRRKLTVTSEEPKLPVRVETFVRGTSETVTLDYSNWARGLELRDSFFEPPAHIALESFDYETYLAASTERPIGPVLYPDLLHGPVRRSGQGGR